MKKNPATFLFLFLLLPLMIGAQSNPQRKNEFVLGSDKFSKDQTGTKCYWNGNSYNPGEYFCNDALQQWVCNGDGSYSYTGKSGTDACPNSETQCSWDGQTYQPGETFCNSANQQWICKADGSYSYTGNTGGSSCPSDSRYCIWEGNLYQTGEYFCNSVDQQWLCNADGTYTFTGNSGGEYCSEGAVLCTWNELPYKTGESICDSVCQQWVCQSSGTFIYTGYSGVNVCPNCYTSTATIIIPTVTPVITSSGCQVSYNTAYENEILVLINQLRAKVNLPGLALDEKLSAAARAHSLDMACKDYFSHSGSDGMSPYDRISSQGYSYSSAGENIAGGNSSPETIVDGWYNSDGHRRNMLSENYTQIGIGYVYSSGSTYGGYWTTNFGKPK